MALYKKISDLPAASSAAGTDQIELNQGGTSRSATLEQAVKAAGATASWVQNTLGANTVVGTAYTAVVNTGSIGVNGQIWEIIAHCMFCEISGGAGGYWDIDLWNGAAEISHYSCYLNVAGGQQNGALTAIVALTGATTFSLRGKGPSSFANILADARITAKRLA